MASQKSNTNTARALVESDDCFTTAATLAPHIARVASYLDACNFSGPDVPHVLDQKDTMEAMLSMVPSGTATGALMQLFVAISEIECVRSLGYDEYTLRQKHRQISRLLYRVLSFLEEAHGLDRADLAGHLYAGDHMDPQQRLPVLPLSAALHPAAA